MMMLGAPSKSALPKRVLKLLQRRPSSRRRWWWMVVVCVALAPVCYVQLGRAGRRLHQRMATEVFVRRLHGTGASAVAYCPEYTEIVQEALRDYKHPGRVVPEAAKAEMDAYQEGVMLGTRVRIHAHNGSTSLPQGVGRNKERLDDLLTNIGMVQRLFGSFPHDFDFIFNSDDSPGLPRVSFPTPEGLILPPLGYTTTERHYDVSIPYMGLRIWEEKKDLGQLTELIKAHPWSSKVPRGVWRGSTTGADSGVVDETNWLNLPRAVLVNISLEYPEILDARFTACKHCAPGMADSYQEAGFGFSSFFTFPSLFNFQALIDVDGNSWSSRFAQLLSTNAVVYKQETEFVEFFRPLLKPWVHYVPINKDLSNLMALLEQTIGNNGQTNATMQEQLQRIAAASTRLYQESLVPSKQLCYLHRLLDACSNIYAQAQRNTGKRDD